MANSFKKSPTLRRALAGATARPIETKWNESAQRQSNQDALDSSPTRSIGATGQPGSGAPPRTLTSTRRPLYDLVKSHRQKFERMHTEFERLGDGGGSSLSPLRRGSSPAAEQLPSFGTRQ